MGRDSIQEAGPNRPLSRIRAQSSQRPRPGALQPSSGSGLRHFSRSSSSSSLPHRPLPESRQGRGRRGSLPQEPREPLRPPLDLAPGPSPSLPQPPRRRPPELRPSLRNRLGPVRRLRLLARMPSLPHSWRQTLKPDASEKAAAVALSTALRKFALTDACFSLWLELRGITGQISGSYLKAK